MRAAWEAPPPGLAPRLRIAATLPGTGADVLMRDPLDLHFGAPARDDPQLQRGGVAQVDDPVAVERPAIVDPHDHLASVARVPDPRIAGDGQGRMGCRHGVHVVDLAARGALAVELSAIPGGAAALAIGGVRGLRHVVATEHGIGTIGTAREGFDLRLRIGRGHQLAFRRRALPLPVLLGAVDLRPGRRTWARGGAATGQPESACHSQAQHRPPDGT